MWQWQLHEHGCPGGQDALIPEEMVALLASAKACFSSTIGGTSGGAGGKSFTVRESVIGLEW